MPEPLQDGKSGYHSVSFSYRGRRYRRSTGNDDLTRACQRQIIIGGRIA